MPESSRALNGMLTSRMKMASMLGYDSFAARALKQAAPASVSEVEYFLLELSRQFRPFVAAEKDGLTVAMPDAWDMGQLEPRVLQRYQQNRPRLHNFLNLENTINGFSAISAALFNVRLERVEPKCESEVWHHSVLKYQVIHQTEGDYGTLYIDPFHRPEKRASDCQFTIQCGKQVEHSYQNPIIVCSFSLGSEMIHFEELRTIFHELGHAIHSFLGRTRYQHLFGTRISTDFAEVPSTLFEYFASDRRILALIAKDATVSEEEEAALRRNNPAAAINKQYTIYQSLCDLRLHSNTFIDVDTTIAQLSEEHAPFEADSYSNWASRFSHFSLYGAKYYSYMYAQGIASRLWQKLFQSDPLNPDAGALLRDGFLRHGNGKKPTDMYTTMLNEKLEPDALIESIVGEFTENQY